MKYFTSPVKGNLESINRQRSYLSVLNSDPKIEIIQGSFFKKKENCPHCRQIINKFEEKKTDVNIATELLTDSYEDNFDVAYIVSGDSDLVPPIQRVLEQGKKNNYYFPSQTQ